MGEMQRKPNKKRSLAGGYAKQGMKSAFFLKLLAKGNVISEIFFNFVP